MENIYHRNIKPANCQTNLNMCVVSLELAPHFSHDYIHVNVFILYISMFVSILNLRVLKKNREDLKREKRCSHFIRTTLRLSFKDGMI